MKHSYKKKYKKTHNKTYTNTYNNVGIRIAKATIRNVIVALLLALILLFIIYGITRKQVKYVVSMVDTISVNTNQKITSNIVFNKEEKKILNRPEYGTKYAEIKINSLGINLPLYFGDTLSILRNGAGQTSGAYFPGEGGTVICMAHNTENMFKRLPEIELGDTIIIEAPYGSFEYEVYDTKIVNMKDVDAIEIQKEEERLAVYTCYPVTGIGHKTDRFIAFAKLLRYE